MRVPTHQPCAAQWLRSMLTLPVVVTSISCGIGETYKTRTYTEPTPRPLTQQEISDAPHPSDQLQNGWKTDELRRQTAVTALQQIKGNDGTTQFPGDELDDERALAITHDQLTIFGPPIAGAAAPQDPKTFGKPADFDNGVVVAGLYLDSPVPAASAYTELNLSAKGVYCVHLKHVGGDGSNWKAYIIPVSGTACPAPGPSTPSLAVQYYVGFPAQADDDYPGTMRLGVDDNGSPFIIARCGKAECFIGSPRVVGAIQAPTDYHDPDGALHGQREKAVRLWHDEQNLALTHPGNVLYPAVRARIVPLKNINKKTKTADFDKHFVPMAWITVPFLPDPGVKYGTGADMHGMRLRPGNNLLWIGYAKTTGTWYAQIEPYDDHFQPLSPVVRYAVPVRYTAHANAQNYAGAARFAWMATDDGLWVPCDQGCCIVSADAVAPPP